MRGREGSGGEQDWNGWDGDAELLHQYPQEEDCVGVMDEEGEGDGHGGQMLGM
jgi:hypothetical protein